MSGLGDDDAPMACIAAVRVSAVQNVGYTAFVQAYADWIGVAVPETKVDHRRRQRVMLHQAQRILARSGCEDHGTHRFAGEGDVHGNERFILGDEDGATSEGCTLHGLFLVREPMRKDESRTTRFRDTVVTSVGHFPANAANTMTGCEETLIAQLRRTGCCVIIVNGSCGQRRVL